MNDNIATEIVKCAKEIFCNGIYVPCNEHPCGWDFISFENLEIEDAYDYIFDRYDISNCIYDDHPYAGLTLIDILEETKGRYAFEIGSINW
jgi:hypothetical protein